MQDPKNHLRKSLRKRIAKASRVAVVGIGSELRGDDAAGLLVVSTLSDSWEREPPRIPAKTFVGSTAPENITGEVRAFAPSHIVLIDCADLGAAPGSCALIDTSAVGGGAGSTHNMPLRVLVDFLEKTMDAEVLLIGIQPECVAFASEMREGVRRGSMELARMLMEELS